MDTANWVELAVLLVIIAAGLLLWRAAKKRLDREGGVEGIVTERGKPARRKQMDVEEEIRQLKERLGRK